MYNKTRIGFALHSRTMLFMVSSYSSLFTKFFSTLRLLLICMGSGYWPNDIVKPPERNIQLYDLVWGSITPIRLLQPSLLHKFLSCCCQHLCNDPRAYLITYLIATIYLLVNTCTWWRHQMETFSALLPICAGNSPVPGEFPTQRPVTPSFDVFFDLRPKKRLSKPWWGWWFETPSCPLWRNCNELLIFDNLMSDNGDVWLEKMFCVVFCYCTQNTISGDYKVLLNLHLLEVLLYDIHLEQIKSENNKIYIRKLS